MNTELQSKSSDNQSDYRPASVYIAPGVSQADEISLVDLLRVIARRKRTILFSFLVVVSLALVYGLFAESVYRAKAHLLPPHQENIQGLLINYAALEGLGIERYTPDLVYAIFLRNLNSRGLRREFFDTRHLADHYVSRQEADADLDINKIFETRFSENLQVLVDKQDPSFVVASLAFSDPELSAQWLNQFVEFANERTTYQLSSDVNVAIQGEIERVQYELDRKRKSAMRSKQDMIIMLKEELRIAKVLGIEDTGYFPGTSGNKRAEITVNTAKLPPYVRGRKALEAEIAVLESRKSEEPFIKGLRDLQESLALLESISINPDTVSATTVDASASTPYRAEKPRRALIMIVAIILGLMGGIFMAFIAEFLSKFRQEHIA